jgi:hypothetical protein
MCPSILNLRYSHHASQLFSHRALLMPFTMSPLICLPSYLVDLFKLSLSLARSLSVGRASSLIFLVSSPYPISRTTTSLNLNTVGIGYDLLEIISTTREYATGLIAFFVWSNPAARDNCTSQRFISMTTGKHLSEGRGGRWRSRCQQR